MSSSNLNAVCYRIWNSILVLGFATALIFEFLEIIKSRTQEELPLQNYKPAASLPRSMRQLSAGWPKDTVRKHFPVLNGLRPIRKKVCAEISPNTHRCQRVFCPLFLSYLHGTLSLTVSRPPTLHVCDGPPYCAVET